MDRPRLGKSLGKCLGKSGAPSDPWLSRQNAPLKLKGHGVTLDVVGARVRLRATMPPRPTDPLGTGLRQHRISTGLAYPDQASEALRGERGTGFGSSFSYPPIGRSQFGLGFWWGNKVCPPVHPPLREVAVR
jgi:hypothetical protein